MVLIRITGVLLAVSLLAFLWPPIAWLVLPVFGLMVILAIADYRALHVCLDGIAVRREMPTTVGRDVPFTVELQLTNRGILPLIGTLRDVVPDKVEPPDTLQRICRLNPKQTARLKSTYRIAERGLYELGPVWTRLEGPWGMLEGQRPLDCTAPIDVYPEQFHVREKLAKDDVAEVRLLDQLTRGRRHGVGTEFQSLAEYRQGDDPRRMDWRATARLGRPIVRRFQVEQHRDLMLILDCGRLMGSALSDSTELRSGNRMAKNRIAQNRVDGTSHSANRDFSGRSKISSKLDMAVDAALLLGRLALASGDRCGVGVFDHRVLGYLPPLSGRKAMRTITQAVYHVQSGWQESDFGLMFATLQARQRKRALVVILSDILDTQTTHRLRASLASLARRHVVVFAALRSPQLTELLHDPIESLLDGHRKMVAIRILREREQAIHAVRRSGVHVLDVQPAELTAPLINQFIALRQANVL